MGIINLDEDKEIVRYIRRSLARRGLKPDFEEDWEVHGPHRDMNYQVYIGYAGNDHWYGCVAIYPRAVYEIDRPSDWWRAYPENRIPTERTRST